MAKKNKKSEARQESVPSQLQSKLHELKEFFELAKIELKKVTWPSRKETVQTGVATLVLVFVVAIYLGLVDMGLTKIIEAILS